MIMFKFFIYSANTHNCQIFTDGWKQVGNIRINENHRLAEYNAEYRKTSTSNVNLGTIPTGYYPQKPIISDAHIIADIKFVIYDTIQLTGTGTGNANINALWRY